MQQSIEFERRIREGIVLKNHPILFLNNLRRPHFEHNSGRVSVLEVETVTLAFISQESTTGLTHSRYSICMGIA